eukprot:7096372-Lingulodinium_polyedra.AAC.1
MLFNLLPRAVPEAFGAEPSRDDGDGDADFHAACARKVRQALDMLSCAHSRLDLVLAFWASEPLDTLNATLQHVDANSKSVFDITYHHGPVWQAQQAYHDMVELEIFALPMQMMVYHFGIDPELDESHVGNMARDRCIQFSAQVWSRFEQVFHHDYPWVLLSIADPRLSSDM